MCDHLNEIVLMLDTFFKGLTDVGLILSYSIQVQVISLDVALTTKIKSLILQLIKTLKIIYSKLSHPVCDHNGKSDDFHKKEKTPSNTAGTIIEETNSISSVNKTPQQSAELVVAYTPLSLATVTNKDFMNSSLLVDGKVNGLNRTSLVNNSSVDNHCCFDQAVFLKEAVSTNPENVLTDHEVEKLGFHETSTEKNETLSTIKLYNIKSVLFSEESLGNWNALHSANVNESLNVRSDNVNVLENISTSVLADKEDVLGHNLVEIIQGQKNCKFDFQLVANRDIGTVLVVEPLNESRNSQSHLLVEEDKLLKNVTRKSSNLKKACDECHCKDFTNEKEFEKHVLEHSKSACGPCKKVFASSDELQEHQRVLHDGCGAFECCLCNKRFLTNADLEKHTKKHNNQFKCTLCNKNFAKKLGLMRHLDFHKEKKEATCDICGKAFSRADYLSIHKSIHAGKLLFSCKSCPKKFLHKRQLKLHEKMHTGVKDYVCEICSKAFSRNDKLKEHIMRHYNIKRFQCDVCCKYYAERRDLRLHMKTHGNSKK